MTRLRGTAARASARGLIGGLLALFALGHATAPRMAAADTAPPPGAEEPSTLARPLAGPSAGLYLAARAAAQARDFAAAADLYDRALAEAPDDAFLLENALLSRLATGDLEAAATLAQRLVDIGQDGQLAHLVRVTDAARREDWRAILAEIEAGRGVSPLVDGLARAWAKLGQGDAAAAISAFDEVAAVEGLGPFALTHKAYALASAGDLEGALAILAAEGMPLSRRAVIARAQILGQLGRNPEAVALIDDIFGSDLDTSLATLRERVGGDERVPFDLVNDPVEGLAEVHFTLAAALAADADGTGALLYARAALALVPGHVDAALLAAGRLAEMGQTRLAAEAYALVPPDNPAFAEAELGRASALRRAGEPGAALAVIELLARDNPALPEVQAALGDHLRALDRLAEAEAAYTRSIDLYGGPFGGQQAGPLWFVLYTRAITRQRLDDWPGAEADLRASLALRPDEPRVLNHLGYSLVERGEALDEALDMIVRAVAADPENGAIVDSLGWAYFQLGRFPEAVVELERAAALLPTDPVVNDHLGDAYWRVGREREARFQWSRALSFAEDPDEAGRIRAKLDGGLDAAGPEALDPDEAGAAATQASGGQDG